MHPNVQALFDHPVASLAVVGNLVLIESLLSVDNAAVLATLVLDLPPHQRPKALRYGIVGAYFFRGLALLFSSLLISIWWLKPIGGLVLLALAGQFFREKAAGPAAIDLPPPDPTQHWLYRLTRGAMGQFWGTVVVVELMDVAFSVDNVFAAAAFSRNLLLIWLGVFIGILAMRFVAGAFVRLMEKFPFLETTAYLTIAVLGLKLLASLVGHFRPDSPAGRFLESPAADWAVSVLTVLIFGLPVLVTVARERRQP